MLLTDNETKVDLLNNEAIAKTIIALLRERPEHPVTIGVHGDWGAGKSSILEMIEHALDSDQNVLCLKFNGWRFQGFEDAKIALIEGIVTGLIEKRPMLVKTGEAVKDIFKRIDWLKVARHGGGLAFTALTGLPTADQVGAVIGTLKGIFADPAKLATKDNFDKAIEGVHGLLKPAESKNVPEEIEHWTIPTDLPARGLAHDRQRFGNGPRIDELSHLPLDRQVRHEGATWLDRTMLGKSETMPHGGFGGDVRAAWDARKQALADMGYVRDLGGDKFRAPSDLIEKLESAEINRAGKKFAAERGLD